MEIISNNQVEIIFECWVVFGVLCLIGLCLFIICMCKILRDYKKSDGFFYTGKNKRKQ